MTQEGVFVSSFLLSHLLQRCVDENDLRTGKKVYDIILKSRHELDALLGSHLILMFASLGTLVEALEVFKKVSEPDMLIWSNIISAHLKQGNSIQAIDLYNQLWFSKTQPNRQIFIAVLQACSAEAISARVSVAALEQGRQVHAHMVEIGHEICLLVGNTLINMYAKCMSPQEAFHVFVKLSERDVVSWNALITGNVHNGHFQEALCLFKQMQTEHVEPNQVTLLAALKACSSISSFTVGEEVHALIIELGLDQSISLGTTMIDMCAKCGMIECATTMFNRLSIRDDVTWSVLIEGYVEHGLCSRALQIFQQMQLEHVNPTSFTFVSIVRACSSLEALEQGEQIHSQAIALGLESHLFVSNSLIDMYGRCGSLEEAKCVFDGMKYRDAVTWSALMFGYAQQGRGHAAVQLFEGIKDGGIEQDPVSYIAAIKACVVLGSLEHHRKIHTSVVESGYESNVYVGSAIIDMYAKDGHLEDACIEFCRLPTQNVATWSAIIAGHAQHDRAQDALLLFRKMEQDGIEPNQVTYVCVLQACSSTAALETGKQVHSKISNSGLGLDVFVGSALIDMYSRCGCLQDALVIFDSLPANNVVTWNALIAGFTLHNDHKSALNVYDGMLQACVMPNDVSFLSLLSVCSRAGLVDEGCSYFKSMKGKHGILPNSQHFNSMVDLLGRAGHLLEAEECLDISPIPLDSIGWTSLLNSSKKHGCVQVGRRCFDYMVASSKANGGTYMLMSSIYRNAGMQEDAEKVEDSKRYVNAWKKPAKAYIEVNNNVHEFINGDKSHPQCQEISTRLKSLRAKMITKAYKPQGEEKADASCGHSEKLAIAFGLINTPDHVTIRVNKNLRTCADCHTMAKMVSGIEMREIVVIDAYCVHQFHNGICSCEVQQ
eukprot:c23559_g1_i1 orf=795-3455(-)